MPLSPPSTRAARAGRILRELGLHTPYREMALVVLSDDNTPSLMEAMAQAGLPCSEGLPNKILLDEVCRRLGKPPLDRENRDEIQAPLREVGLVGKALFDSSRRIVISDVWKSKSNYCLYRLRPEARFLLSEVSEAAFGHALDDWLSDTTNRKARIISRYGV